MSNLPASGVALGFLEALIGSPIIIIVTLLALLVAGVIIIFVVGTLLLFLPALIVAGVVWWMTGSELFAGASVPGSTGTAHLQPPVCTRPKATPREAAGSEVFRRKEAEGGCYLRKHTRGSQALRELCQGAL